MLSINIYDIKITNRTIKNEIKSLLKSPKKEKPMTNGFTAEFYQTF
jgi:hypothetical protein